MLGTTCSNCADDDDDAVLFAKIKSGKYDVEDPVWDRISTGAKLLVSRMLCVDAAQRLKSAECLQDEWLRSYEAGFENLKRSASRIGAPTRWCVPESPQQRSERQAVSVTRLLSARSVRRQGLPQGEGHVGWLCAPGEFHQKLGVSNGCGTGEPGSSSADDVAFVTGDTGGEDIQGGNEATQWPSIDEYAVGADHPSGRERFSFQ
jgi:serine/threonine protein kinase